MTAGQMRVLVFTNMYPTEEKPWWGTFVEEQVDDLRRLNVDVSVLHFDATNDRGEYRRAAARFRSTLRSKKFDLVHAHYGLTGAIAVAQRRVPVVTTFHGGDYTGLIRWHAAVSRVVCRLCTPIVVTADGRTKLRIPHAAVIPAGVNTDLFQPADRLSARRALGLDESASYALLLGGRDDANKRPDLFDAAVEHARREVPDLRSLSLDQAGREDVVHLMNAADVAVLTSDREGLPVALREALACMTPVVWSRSEALRRFSTGSQGARSCHATLPSWEPQSSQPFRSSGHRRGGPVRKRRRGARSPAACSRSTTPCSPRGVSL